jgi:SPP1 gp7 family putative phage head morphogenesis protein
VAELDATTEDLKNKSIEAPTDKEVADTEVAEEKVGAFNKAELGTSGSMIFGELFDEEYLSKLMGKQRADIFDEMMRSDDTITMLLTARKNPILKANWSFEPAKGDTPELEAIYKKHAEHAEHEFFERMKKDFLEFVEEALTFVEHGFSVFERVHQTVEDKKFGSYIGYRNLGYRSQRTLERWQLKRDGSIESIYQESDGDLDSYVYIPGQWVTVFSLRKTGDNYEGLSALRSIYGNWQRKQIFLKLVAIGLERYAINTPVGKVPKGLENSEERTKFVNMLKAISSHQQNYFTLPEGWDVDFLQNPFDAAKVVDVIRREDEGMVKSFVANHLNLGQGGSSGSYALGTDLSDQFLSIIENDAAIITRRFNKDIVKEFIDFNYGPQTAYPKLKVTGINDKFSKEFSEIIKMLADGKFLTPTENLERWLRRRLDVPELLEADAAKIEDVRKIESGGGFGAFSEKSSTFADLRATKSKIKQQLDSSAIAVAQSMTEDLRARAVELLDSLIKAMRQAPRAQWRSIIRSQGAVKNQSEYTRKLKKALAETSGRAIAQARNEVPGGRKVKFAEAVKSRLTFGEVEDALSGLPKNIRDLILTDAELVADTQLVKISNSVLLKASAGVDETADLAVLHKRTLDEIEERLSGAGETGLSGDILTAATNLTSKVYNTSRLEFFQAPEVLAKIEAFQFTNTDPVSPICQDLNGRIFAKNDPESDQYLPPLHHNCKSFIVPIFDLQGKEISELGLSPSKAGLDKYKTL